MSLDAKLDALAEYQLFQEERALNGVPTTPEDWRDHLAGMAYLDGLQQILAVAEKMGEDDDPYVAALGEKLRTIVKELPAHE